MMVLGTWLAGMLCININRKSVSQIYFFIGQIYFGGKLVKQIAGSTPGFNNYFKQFKANLL